VDFVVPLSMKRVSMEIHQGEFFIWDLDTCRVLVEVQFRANGEAVFGCGRRNQADDHLETDQRFSSPVLRDEAEEAMFNFVPLAGAWRQVAYGDNQSSLIGQLLQLRLPKPDAASIAATTICCYEQAFGVLINGLPHRPPPAADTFHGERRRVVVQSNVDPA